MNDPHAITQPVKEWNKLFGFNYQNLFTTLGELVIDTATLDLKGVLKDVLNLAGVADLKEKDWKTAAWAWITRSVLRAIISVIDEHATFPRRDKDQQIDVTKLSKNIEDALSDVSVTVDLQFFENPKPLPLLEALREPFQAWLMALGATPEDAAYAATRLPSQFAIELHIEWLDNHEQYAQIPLAVEGPTAKVYMQRRKWQQYDAYLMGLPSERVFTEKFGIKDIYVQLRGAYEIERDDPNHKRYRAVMLLDHTVQWLGMTDSKDCIRLVHGGPKCGKSTFAKMLAARLAQEGVWTTLFVPLHRFNVKDDLLDSLDDFCRKDKHCPENPLGESAPSDKVCIIFDGLDELSETGSKGKESANDFVRNVRQELHRSNQQGVHLKIILSGRDLSIQSQSSSFLKTGQILSVLPYRLPLEEQLTEHHSDLDNRARFDDPDNLLGIDQRDEWWKLYAQAKNLPCATKPAVFKEANLDEITAQPMLNYLVALCQDEDGNFDFDKDSTLNSVYRTLLQRVHERDAEKACSPWHMPELTHKDFTRVLEEIAVTAWHGKTQRTTSVSKLLQRCKTDHAFGKLFERFSLGAEKGLVKLLTAFFAREAGTAQEEKTFEFTHKTFGEYLTALRIVREAEKNSIAFQENNLDMESALKTWALLCGPCHMDRDLFRFVHQEIALRDSEQPGFMKQCLEASVELFNYTLKEALPMDHCGLTTYHAMREHARNAEESLLAVLSACTQASDGPVKIAWPSKTSFGELCSRLRLQRFALTNTLAYDCFHDLDISKQYLLLADLWRANLRGSDLRGADLRKADLGETNLKRANIERANLGGANLKRANLRRANLREADLRRAIFGEANFEGANLEGTKLGGGL